MYSDRVLASGAIGAAATLPFTGLNLVWVAVAAFTLLMTAGALWRLAPRREG